MNSTKDSDAVEAQFDDDLTNELEYSGSFVELAIEDRVKERTLEYLEAKKEADIASVSKSVFLANLSHEIRTPLNAILGYAQILDREADLETAHARYVDSILKGARHLLSLVNGVLDISKIEAGHIEITPREFDFYAVMETIESLAQSYVAQGGVEYRFICEANVPRFIQADETRMRQVVVNLVSNAFKFTDEGSVTVRAGYEDFPRRQLIIAVEDTGIGISDEEIDEVFKPFSQSGHASASDRAKGTGLGLAISKEIVRLMGGSIKVESELG
ncbi:MAG: ATP-binding protein, partial [Gammaproteobacteria bacterium]